MKNTILRLSALVMLLVSGSCMVGCGGGGDGSEDIGNDGMTSQEWSSRIHLGMTEAEVIAAIGRPADGQGLDSRGYLVYSWRFGNAQGTVIYGDDGKTIITGYSPDLYGRREAE